jgi:hypothetical protein
MTTAAFFIMFGEPRVVVYDRELYAVAASFCPSLNTTCITAEGGAALVSRRALPVVLHGAREYALSQAALASPLLHQLHYFIPTTVVLPYSVHL